MGRLTTIAVTVALGLVGGAALILVLGETTQPMPFGECLALKLIGAAAVYGSGCGIRDAVRSYERRCGSRGEQ